MVTELPSHMAWPGAIHKSIFGCRTNNLDQDKRVAVSSEPDPPIPVPGYVLFGSRSRVRQKV